MIQNIGAAVVMAYFLLETLAPMMDTKDVPFVRDVVDIGDTAPPRPTCGFGKMAIFSPTENKWHCVPKQFG